MEEEKARQSALRAENKEQKTGKKRGRLPNLRVSGKGKRKKGFNGKVVVVGEEEDNEEEHEPPVFQQPSLVTGAKLKPYQLEGLQWMVSLDQNGISGILGSLKELCRGQLRLLTHVLLIILADEMGLGKVCPKFT